VKIVDIESIMNVPLRQRRPWRCLSLGARYVKSGFGFESEFKLQPGGASFRYPEGGTGAVHRRYGCRRHDHPGTWVDILTEWLYHGQQSILLSMATGTGKTRTILGLIWRKIKKKQAVSVYLMQPAFLTLSLSPK